MALSKIDDAINLVFDLPNGLKLYHTPISESVFEANFKILAETKAQLFGRGMAYAASSGIRVARLTLCDEGRKLAEANGQEGDSGATSLLTEIARLTNVLVPAETGWEPVPVATAISQGHLDADDWKDEENVIVFFTCAYALASRRAKKLTAEAIAEISAFSVTSLNCADYMRFLQTPADTEKPEKIKKTSSVPV